MSWSASILIGRFRRRRREFPIIVSKPLVILRLHLRDRDRDRIGSWGRLRSVEASDEVLQIRGTGPVRGEGRGALGRRGRRRRPGGPFLLLLTVVVVGAEQGEGQRAPRLLPGRRGGGGGSGGGRRGGARVGVGSEPARHEVAPVVVEGREGGGRLRRGGRGGEGEVAEIEVLVEERRGRRRERDGVHCVCQRRGTAVARACVRWLMVWVRWRG